MDHEHPPISVPALTLEHNTEVTHDVKRGTKRNRENSEECIVSETVTSTSASAEIPTYEPFSKSDDVHSIPAAKRKRRNSEDRIADAVVPPPSACEHSLEHDASRLSPAAQAVEVSDVGQAAITEKYEDQTSKAAEQLVTAEIQDDSSTKLEIMTGTKLDLPRAIHLEKLELKSSSLIDRPPRRTASHHHAHRYDIQASRYLRERMREESAISTEGNSRYGEGQARHIWIDGTHLNATAASATVDSLATSRGSTDTGTGDANEQ